MIHRSTIGSLERVFGFLIEHYAGAFPAWLSPVQVHILPISDEKHGAYAAEILSALRTADIRAELDLSTESLGKKIRNAKIQKSPYIIVVGDAEVNDKTVTVESRDAGKLDPMSVADFVTKITTEISTRA